MNEDWQNLADMLREELEEYGALLGHFDEQQTAIIAGDSTAVLASARTLEDKARHLQGLRLRREERVKGFALAMGRDPKSTLTAILGGFAPEVRPLLDALVREINHLVHRTRRRAGQNHLLLSRAVEIRQEILQTLRPGAFSKTYSRRGRVTLASPGCVPSYRATG
jgi:flagellar biosynthesis/type III secretory pathway chaperone